MEELAESQEFPRHYAIQAVHYDLVAIIHHLASSTTQHFVTYIKNYKNVWMCCDDDKITLQKGDKFLRGRTAKIGIYVRTSQHNRAVAGSQEYVPQNPSSLQSWVSNEEPSQQVNSTCSASLAKTSPSPPPRMPPQHYAEVVVPKTPMVTRSPCAMYPIHDRIEQHQDLNRMLFQSAAKEYDPLLSSPSPPPRQVYAQQCESPETVVQDSPQATRGGEETGEDDDKPLTEILAMQPPPMLPQESLSEVQAAKAVRDMLEKKRSRDKLLPHETPFDDTPFKTPKPNAAPTKEQLELASSSEEEEEGPIHEQTIAQRVVQRNADADKKRDRARMQPHETPIEPKSKHPKHTPLKPPPAKQRQAETVSSNEEETDEEGPIHEQTIAQRVVQRNAEDDRKRNRARMLPHETPFERNAKKHYPPSSTPYKSKEKGMELQGQGRKNQNPLREDTSTTTRTHADETTGYRGKPAWQDRTQSKRLPLNPDSGNNNDNTFFINVPTHNQFEALDSNNRNISAASRQTDTHQFLYGGTGSDGT